MDVQGAIPCLTHNVGEWRNSRRDTPEGLSLFKLSVTMQV